MSAELICFILYGPRTLSKDPDLVKRAVDNAKAIIDIAREMDRLLDTGHDIESQLDKVIELGGPSMDDLDELWIMDVLGLDPEKVIGEFIEAWNEGAEDTNCREFPTSDPLCERVVFIAGSMSWGDEPDSFGYQAMKKAQQLGVFQFFGVE